MTYTVVIETGPGAAAAARAESAKAAAETSATAAAASETAADASETAAANSATSAATSATSAATSATSAAASAASAATSASESAASAAAAETAATAAEASAAETDADRVQTGLDRAAAASHESDAEAARDQATLAALSAGAPLVTTLTTPTPADDTIEMLQTDAGVQVWQVVSGTWAVQGWLGEVLFDDVSALLASTYTGFSVGHVMRTRKEGFSYQVVSSGEHLTTAGGVKLYVLTDGTARNVKAFGAVGDGVTDDTAAIQATIDSISNAANLGRGGGTVLLFPFGSYVSSSSFLIDQKNIEIQGDGSTITHSAASPAFLLGDVSYLSDFATNNAYRVVSINNISIVLSNASGVGVKNNGVRKVLMENVYVRGGARGVEFEAAFGLSRLRAVTCQLQSDRGFSILKRNNVIRLEKCAALSGASVGFYISTDGAGPAGELHAVTLDQCDAEGCVTGYQVSGNNIGPVLLKNCWSELNIGNSVYVTGAAATNTYGVRIDGGQFDSDVVFGQTGGGRLRGCSIEGANFSNASLRIYATSGVEVGHNSYLGTGALVFENGQPIGPAEYYAAAERQPLFAVGHGTPYQTNDSRGKIGELRWDNSFAYIKVGASAWHRSQLSSFGDGQVAPLPTGATPSTVGLRACRTANSGATTITSFPDGQDGQELIIIGADGGNTTVAASAAKLPGGTPITLGDNDVLHLVCRQDVTPIWVCVSYSNNPA